MCTDVMLCHQYPVPFHASCITVLACYRARLLAAHWCHMVANFKYSGFYFKQRFTESTYHSHDRLLPGDALVQLDQTHHQLCCWCGSHHSLSPQQQILRNDLALGLWLLGSRLLLLLEMLLLVWLLMVRGAPSGSWIVGRIFTWWWYVGEGDVNTATGCNLSQDLQLWASQTNCLEARQSAFRLHHPSTWL